MIFPYKHKTYYGFDDGNAPNVFVSNAGRTIVPLPLRLDIVNHSPTGFAWGYSGSTPTKLAVAILADRMRCDHAAQDLHQRFKFGMMAFQAAALVSALSNYSSPLSPYHFFR